LYVRLFFGAPLDQVAKVEAAQSGTAVAL